MAQDASFDSLRAASAWLVRASVGLALMSCEGRFGFTPHGGSTPPPVLLGSDAGRAMDASVTPGTDAYTLPLLPDAYTSVTDAYVPSTGGPCTLGAPLAAPIAGCHPSTPATTGDPAEDCVRRINQFRCECQHLQPLMRWRDGEACANQMAQYDVEHGGAAHAGFAARICNGGNAQNECPGWPSVPACVDGCLQLMWDEGPGNFYGGHGHYINMSSTTLSAVACGFYTSAGGTTAVQNFHWKRVRLWDEQHAVPRLIHRFGAGSRPLLSAAKARLRSAFRMTPGRALMRLLCRV